MKTRKIFLLAILFCLSYNLFAQTDVKVENHVSTTYSVTAVYVNGANQLSTTYNNLIGGSSYTIEKDLTGNPGYALSHWRISALNCNPVLDANHAYGVSDWDQITHCQQCNNNAYSSYGIGQLPPYEHKVYIGCKD
ncbi:MAG: hypothetical protein U9R19_10105 [Bacteroidota bacterium]|nr:hypothetical protein [Bacteroidota bacterium]